MDLKELMRYAFHDKKHIRRNTIIQIVIATLAVILLCRVWPYQMVQRHTESNQQAYTSLKEITGENFTNTDKKLQTVRFTQGHLYQMMLYLTCNEGYDENSDYVVFRLYNDSFSCIYEETQGFGLLEREGGFRATPDMDVEIGRDYYYEVLIPEDTKGSLRLPVADKSSLAQEENTILYVDGIYQENISLIADYDYTKELTFFHIIGYDLLILVFAIISYFGIVWSLYYFEDYLEIAGILAKKVVTGFVILAGVAFLVFAVIMNGFGGQIADRLVYAGAGIGAVAWFLLAVWYPGTEKKASKLSEKKQYSLIWRNYIQTVSFGLLFYALCQYVNVDREYYHYVNTRWMLIFLGIAFLMIYAEKELCNYMSGIWLVLSVVGSVIYCYGIEGEEELYLAKLAGVVIVVWGLLVISVLRTLKKDFWKTLYWPFFAVWLFFAVLMYIYRFERVWVFVATLPFCVLLFMNLNAAAKSRLLKNITNGMILSFGLVMLFCLKHRPYHYWLRYRYNGFFHTVACTGMYLVVVSGAILGKLYGKWTAGKKLIQSGKKELFLLGLVVTNILLSMSRTALLTLGVNIVLITILAAVSYKKQIKRIVCETAVVAGAIIICFPLMYSAIRIVPAVVNKPINYSVEKQERYYTVSEGDRIDSDKYMTIERYFNVFFGRFQTEGEASNKGNVKQEEMLLAYIGKESLPINLPTVENSDHSQEEKDDVSNGRFEIYMDYIDHLTIGGHETMCMEGKNYGHAHNSYIQIAYDFGWLAGIAFLILCAITLWKSIMLAYRYGKNYNIYFVPFSMIVVFGFTSLTEWAFHPCIPVGFVFLLMQVLLLQKPWGSKQMMKDAERNTKTE